MSDRGGITNEWLDDLNRPQGFSKYWNHLSNFANRKLTMACLLPMCGVEATIASIEVTCLVPVASVLVSDAWSTLFCTVVCVMAYWKGFVGQNMPIVIPCSFKTSWRNTHPIATLPQSSVLCMLSSISWVCNLVLCLCNIYLLCPNLLGP